MKTGLFLASLCSFGAASAWTPASSSSSTASSRRNFLNTAAKVLPLVVVAAPAFADEDVAAEAPAEAPAAEAVVEEAPAAVTSTAATAENEFIARLKANSEAKKDIYKKMAESNDKLSKAQFASQYGKPKYIGVHTANNDAVKMVLSDEFEELLASGKVVQAYESKVSKKTGEISDDYSKPIFKYAN